MTPGNPSASPTYSGGAGAYPASTLLSNSLYYSISRHDGQSIFTSKGHIYGSAQKKTKTDCGKIRSVHVCSKDPGHEMQNRHICCNEPTCPICYPKFVHRLADGITERVKGYQEVYPKDPFCHLVLSPPPGTEYKNMKEAFAAVSKVFLKRALGKAASVNYHPYRLRKELIGSLWMVQDVWIQQNPGKKPPGFWKLAHDNVLKLDSLSDYVVYGPHFHAIATGYLIKSNDFHRITNWIYKKVKHDSFEDEADEGDSTELNIGDVVRLAHYLGTHTAWEWGKHSVRYIGAMSYAKLGRTKEGVRREQVKCKVCGAAVHEHTWMGLTEEIGDCIRTEIEERIILWKYWKREKKKRKKKDDVPTIESSRREEVGYSELIGR